MHKYELKFAVNGIPITKKFENLGEALLTINRLCEKDDGSEILLSDSEGVVIKHRPDGDRGFWYDKTEDEIFDMVKDYAP